MLNATDMEPAQTRIRLVIADDHAIVRRGVRLMLQSQPDMEIVGEAEDGEDAVHQAEMLRPNVVIMDLAMPKLPGIEATRLIRQRWPEVHVLGLTMHEDQEYFFQLVQAGASGYVVKGASPDDLLSGVRAVAAGKAYLCPGAAQAVLDDYLHRVQRGEESESYGRLTPREQEVVTLIGEGLTAHQIAARLFLSEHTVARHRANTMEKLGLHNKAELIRYAVRAGLVSAGA